MLNVIKNISFTKSITKTCVVIAFIFIQVAAPLSVYAADKTSCDLDCSALNDILFSDPNATALPCRASSTTSSSAASSENTKAILEYFTSKGLTLAQAAGFAGNMSAESGLDPAKIQGGAIAPDTYTPVNGVGFGLIQWTFTSRQKPLVDAAIAAGKPVTNLDVQLDYIWSEVTTSYKSTLEALIADNKITPVEATIIIHGKTPSVANDPRFANAPTLGYEASADSADIVVNNRGAAAQKYYNDFRSTISDGVGVQGAVSTGDPTAGNCGSGASAECKVTAPIYGEGGNGHQLSEAELSKFFGGPDPDALKPNLTTVDFLGKQVQVNKLVAGCLSAVAKDIEARNVNYTIRQMGGYRYDSNNGSSNIGTKSYHTYGAAVDINPDTNPFVGNGTAAHDMPQEYIDAFHSHGWSWGGNWRSVKDYMHFEFNGIETGGL